MDTQSGALRALLAGQKPAATELEVTKAEAAVLGRYVAQYRPELLRRWRAGILVVGMNGLLREPVAPARTREQRKAADALDRYAIRKNRQHRKALAAAKRRRH